jgi:glycosyltransferase involved in cell wall biosynthesis
LKGHRHCGFHHIHTSADVDEQYFWPSLFRSFVQRAKRLVACSQATRTNLVEAGARGEISFLPYLTSLAIPGLEPMEGRPIHCPKRFAFIGRVEKSKGIDLIMEAARSPDCAGIEWHIHGEGEYLDALRSEKLPTVFLHGGFSGSAALDKIHSEADALILPSFHSEGMPLALLEGMAKGLPWIATNKGGIAELAGGHEDLMVFEPGDVGSFIRSSARMRDRLDNCLVDRIAIQRFFRGSFAKEVVTRQWLEYCDQFLGSEP